MKPTTWAAAALAAALLAACTAATPTNTPSYRVQMMGMSGASSTSSSSYNVYNGTAYTADRATDGDPNTEWASRDGDTEATLNLQLPQKTKFTAVRIKAQPTQGSEYVIESSDDGVNWGQISGVLHAGVTRERRFQTETKRVQGEGRYIRVRWMKLGSNLRHWSVFEIQPIGTPVEQGGEGATVPLEPGGPSGAVGGGVGN